MILTWSWEFWFLMAQAMGVVTICIEFASYQINNHRKYLLVTSIANVFWMLMFLFMGLHTNVAYVLIMIIAAAFGVLRGMIFWWIFAKNTRRRKIAGRIALYASLGIMLPFTIRAILNLEIPAQIIIQSIGLATGLLFIVGQYLSSKHYRRLFAFMYATVIFIGNTPLNMRFDEYGGGHWNYMGMFIELSKIASIVVFYVLTIYRGGLAKKLVKIKVGITRELEKIKTCTSTEQLMEADIMSANEFETMTARMMRYELIIIEKSDVIDIKSAEAKTQPVLEDVKILQEVKSVMPTLVELDKQKEEQKISKQ